MKVKKSKKKSAKQEAAEQLGRAIKGGKKEKKSKKKSESIDKTDLIASDSVEVLPVLTDAKIEKQAIADDKRFRELEHTTRTSFAEMCIIIRRVDYYKEWKHLTSAKTGKPYRSRDQWMAEAAPQSRASSYVALRAAEKLLPTISEEEFKELPRHSIELMAKVPKLKLEKDSPIRKAAKAGASRKEMVRVIKKHSPESHVEDKEILKIDKSASPVIDDAFQAIQDLMDVTPPEVLEALCTAWMDAPCELEQYQGLSNREAWERWKQGNNAESTAAELRAGD